MLNLVTTSSSFILAQTSLSLLTLALGTHLSLTTSLYFLPLALLLVTTPVSYLASPRPLPFSLKEVATRIVPLVAEFCAYVVALAGAATLTSGGWGWLDKTWGAVCVFYLAKPSTASYIVYVRFTLPDLTPNTGLWWYFFTEMFDHFRPFFLMVFSVSHLRSIYLHRR